jgi:long-chain acyl-CoA synthetase
MPKERLAYLGKNEVEFFEILFGAAKLNVVPVAVSWRLSPDEVVYIIGDAQAKLVIVDEEFVELIDQVQSSVASVGSVVVIGKHSQYSSYEDWIEDASIEDVGLSPDPGDIAIQVYTSGTTGLPKGAMLTNKGLLTFLNNLIGPLGLTRESVSLIALPLFHIGGSAWALLGLTAGSKSILLRDADPSVIVDVVGRHRVSNLMLVPALLQFILDLPGIDDADLSSVRSFVYGGSPISEVVLRRGMERLGCQFLQLYGLTEAGGSTCQLAPEDHDLDRPHLLRSCGRPLPWIDVRVFDPDTGEEMPQGEVGELWMRSEQNMAGYWGKPEATERAMRSDGWLRSGDAGYQDEDGYLFLHDRINDMIVTGGENVYPIEVENVLMAHPGIADATVIGVPHETWGETVKAIVVIKDAVVLEPSSIIEFSRTRLAHFKCPTSVDFLSVLPRTPAGKVLKRELREPFWVGHQRRIS